ncbi:MAG: IS5/IS1182 family transposase [Nanoarchaeota archaeon]|nr:IS5/IS1182 family transposase [Nanoarchaeota archaeon]
MAKNKRWGKEFEDKRNHKQYQAELLKRYEIYLDLDWVESWEDELKEMNKGKRGAPYQFPNSMIEFQALLVEKFSTRGAEAITRKLEGYKLIPKCNDHATIHRRILKINLKFSIPKGVEIHEGTDGSGFKMTNAGEYFQSTYGQTRRKFARVVITATKDDILKVEVVVNEKGVKSEPEIAEKHISEILNEGGNIVKSYDDGAFDTKKFFNFLEDNNIESAIRIRSDASTKARGSIRRKKEVIKFKELGYRIWADDTDYGGRWPLTEGHFSGIKRGYGDSAKGKKTENILIELKRKVWIYNKVRKYGRT